MWTAAMESGTRHLVQYSTDTYYMKCLMPLSLLSHCIAALALAVESLVDARPLPNYLWILCISTIVFWMSISKFSMRHKFVREMSPPQNRHFAFSLCVVLLQYVALTMAIAHTSFLARELSSTLTNEYVYMFCHQNAVMVFFVVASLGFAAAA
jgi:hypothetical protein